MTQEVGDVLYSRECSNIMSAIVAVVALFLCLCSFHFEFLATNFKTHIFPKKEDSPDVLLLRFEHKRSNVEVVRW